MGSPIILNVFATTKKKFMERFKKVVPVARKIQIDIMDGYFVNARSLSVQDKPNLYRYGKSFEVHLMVSRPSWYIAKLKKKGCNKIIFHVESRKDEEEVWKTINEIKKLYMIPCLALNPETPLKAITPYLEKVRYIMFMGITPGSEGQRFKPDVYKKIKALRKLDPTVKIQVDGGVNDKTASKLAKAGCTYLNTGSFVGEAEDPKKAKKILEREFKKGLK